MGRNHKANPEIQILVYVEVRRHWYKKAHDSIAGEGIRLCVEVVLTCTRADAATRIDWVDHTHAANTTMDHENRQSKMM